MSQSEDNESTLFQGKKTDETWKQKAQKEKEKLSEPNDAGQDDPLPTASFLRLVEELSMRAMLAMGQLVHPSTGEGYFDLEGAKYAIDLLGILEQKTRGNLDPQEERGLKDVLHGLRLAFLHVSRNPPATTHNLDGSAGVMGDVDSGLDPGLRPRKGGGEEKPSPKIIL